MSYTFLQATGEESSAESFQEMLRCAPWKSDADAGKLCYKGSMMESSLGFRFGTTCELSTADHGAESRRSSAADFLAQTFLPLEPTTKQTENNLALMAQALDSGERWRESLAKCNLKLCVLKTPQTYALADLSKFSKTLTAWGIMQNGACCNVATSAQTISEKGFSSLLPTPTAHNAKEGAYPAEFTRNTPTLSAQIGGKINPDWNEWRMGCPHKWSDCAPLAIDKFRSWLRSHGKL